MDFNFKRFILILRKDIADSSHKIIVFALSALSFIIIAETIIGLINANNAKALTEALGNFNVFIFLVTATIMPSLSFLELSHKPSASAFLMLPASTGEKFASRWVMAIPGSIVLFIAISVIADTVAMFIVSHVCNPEGGACQGWLHHCTSPDFNITGTLTDILALQSFYFLGAVLWPRLSWAKTSVGLLGLAALYTGLTMIIVYALSRTNTGFYWEINGIEKIRAISLFIIPANYIISFFRLKEAEVINRF